MDLIKTKENTIELKDGFYFVPLGGTEEIGMNFNLFGVVEKGKEEWLIVDAGVTMNKTLGIKLKFASIDYALTRNIIGCLITHGHEDHIGCLPFILPRFKNQFPIFCTQFTSILITEKLKDNNVLQFSDIQKVDLNADFNIGMFDVGFISVAHSILEPNMLLIKTKYGVVIHTGDWKFEEKPLESSQINYAKIKSISSLPNSVLICDSTGSETEERTLSESESHKNLSKFLEDYKEYGVIASLFSSNMMRVSFLIDEAKKRGRKVVLLGRSMLKVFNAAVSSGYLKEEDHIIKQDEIKNYNPKNLLIICTGSQGEHNAVLQKMANGFFDHQIKIDKRFVVLFSSRVIPGNEVEINDLKNSFIRMGALVIDPTIREGIHASGHPGRVEIKELINLCNPKLFIPVHGDAMHLQAMKELWAEERNNKNIIVPFNGALISLSEKKIIGKVDSGKDGLDGKQVIALTGDLLRHRKILGEEGVVIVSVLGNRSRISIFGVISSQIIRKLENALIKEIQEMVSIALREEFNRDEVNARIKNDIGNLFTTRFGKRPALIVHII